MRDRSQVVASIKDWLSVCNGHHATCVNAPDAQSARPTWLINVEDQCIVQGEGHAKYIALSYTWLDTKGQSSSTENVQLLSSNIDWMKTPDALRKDASKLPSVIKDAIELTSLLGERWLWVDRLCIVQDGSQKMAECLRMDKIYAGAYMTIAAAARGGLFAEIQQKYRKPDSAHRNTDEKVRHYYQELKKSKWAKRAWTYQEYILSQRVVFFLDTVIFWQCEIAIWDTQSILPSQEEQALLRTKPGSTLLRHLETPAYPDFSLYADIICPYNGRELSYQEDGLSACLGILNRLEPAFPGGFIFGLPRIYLDHALLWQPLKAFYCDYDSGTSASEMFPGYGPSYTPPRSSAFGALSDGCAARKGRSTRRPSLPSWSWCGWQCFVDPKSYPVTSNSSPDSDQKTANASWTLRNLVTWKSISEKGSEKGPSPGLSVSNQISARVASACFLSAATLEIRVYPSRTFHYIGFMRSSVNSVLAERPLKDMPAVVVIQDKSGLFSGLLRVTGNSTREEGQEMKLIAISQGSATGLDLNGGFEANILYRSRYYDPQPFYAVYDQDERWIGLSDENVSGWPHRGEDKYQVLATGAYKHDFEPPITGYDHEVTYEFFNVLWVEDGGDGVSYRAGCGYVLKDRWESMAPTETNIILG